MANRSPNFSTNSFLAISARSSIRWAYSCAVNSRKPDFIPIGYGLKDVTYHNVITEWHAANPSANTFEGTRRELLRAAHIVENLTHPMGAVEFNPYAKPGETVNVVCDA